jgi:hypothetical protein
MNGVTPYHVTLISADTHRTQTIIASGPFAAMRIALNTLPQQTGPCAISCTPGCRLVEEEEKAA